jgi:protein-S-isoprenylcysteine O-methyltransferase Ste14
MADSTVKFPKPQVIRAAIWLMSVPVLVLYLAGDWLWIEGWIFDIWFLAVCLTTITYLRRKDPELLAERMKPKFGAGQMKWDRYFLPFFQGLFVVWIIIMPLDARRFHWTAPLPLWLRGIGFLGLAGSFFFLFRAFAENTFASPLVRIQTERHQHVVTTGVYSIIRHPMYLGGILLNLATPLLLGSKYGLVIGALVTLMIAGRIIGEEKMLATQLEGYEDYRKRVKYRLIPFVW